MALATQCPHCHTTFRVAHDQLKLRAGLVRCGACKQIFNGIENLLRPEELAGQSAPVTPPVQPPLPAPTPDSDASSPLEAHALPAAATEDVAEDEASKSDTLDEEANAETPEPTPSAAIADTPVETREDPLLRMTLMDFAHARGEPASEETDATVTARPEEPDDVERAIEDLSNKPWRRQQAEREQAEEDALDRADEEQYVEPAFVRQGRRKERIGRIIRIVMASASVILLFTLLAQSAYVFRDRIAAWFPQSRPILAEACARLGCQVGLPAQIDSVSIESSELQALGVNTNTFSLTILLRNHGATDQAWPHVELTLNDNNEVPIARRVFSPREYLPTASGPKTGFAAFSEQPVKLFFELSQLKASGYRVYLFYP